MVIEASRPESGLSSVRFDMVVDIQPMSRVSGNDLDLPDIASIQSTLILERGKALQLSQQVPVFERGDDGYRLELEVPPEWVELVKGADFHVVVLMPRDINGWELQFDANELVSEFRNAESFSVDASALPGPRSVITWTGTIDDPLPVVWKYLRA